jgi:transcriptional regulator with XRE-family HTH domain
MGETRDSRIERLRQRGVLASTECIQQLKEAQARQRNAEGKVRTLTDVAIESGVDVKTVSRFLNQRSKVDETTAIAICQALGVKFEAENNPQDTKSEPDRTGQLSMNPFIYGDPVPLEKVTDYIAWCNFKVSEEKQIADKFSKAIDQFGSEGDEKIYIRLGGIYTLEQIAQNSKEYHWTIMEILSDFIREKRSIRQPLDMITCEPKTSAESFIQVPIDICAAFTALGRRNVIQDPAGKRINLLRVDLAEMKLSDAQSFNLSNIILCHSNLSWNHFANVDFSGANLNGCYLNHTHFGNANMSKALLSANFSGTILGKTNFSNSDLAGAIFNGASVDGAIFSGADLSGKFFYCGANFSNVHYLEKAIFDETTVVDEKTIFPEGFEFKQGRIRKVV